MSNLFKYKLGKPVASICVAMAISAGMADVCWAGTGLYTTGYGTREQGMGGVGIATGESGLAPAVNPAGIAFSGDRLDIGGGLLIINAGSTSNGTTYAGKTGFVPLPEFGYVHSLSPSLVFGVASWTSGAQIDYGTPFGSIPGNSDTSAQAIFLHVAPTAAYRFGLGGQKNNAISLALVGALSTLDAKGIEAQTSQSNQGRAWAPGYGFKVGWMSQITSQFALGAFYSSKISYSSWSRYSKIFADGARFEEPEQYGIGVAFRPTPKWLLGFDWIRFNYGDTHVLGNPVTFAEPLGSPNGAGQGFNNINAYRFGVQYDLTDRITVRGGFEYTDQLMSSDNTGFGFLVPVPANRTYTLGGTYKIDKSSALSFSWAISPRVQVTGTGISTGANPYAQDNVISFSYTKRL
ncbi:MAG TPA: outer membrane protein transport protein [Eoetvoesiella sp.]|uniref:OmpP1/FadL family transporter n=1 Tax=Eoetvoesiella sp. TaxID=1966355 RepID=UPI002BE01A88|nr:outer membrane protein transport protein [Eoetvoesiella sp.]HWK63246.1 outer membrane protein transport protein [Eoetvoesiella sp.]